MALGIRIAVCTGISMLCWVLLVVFGLTSFFFMRG